MSTNILKNLFPFLSLEDKELHLISEELSFSVQSFEKNDIILSKEHFESELGFVLSGECEVYRARIKEDILLQSLKKNDSFGILTLFSKEEYPTTIIAKKKSKILFIPKEQFLACLIRYPTVSINVMTFLAGRIQFLNKKIATLCGATVEEKVLQYLTIQFKEQGERFLLNASRVAELLNIGRASLYRVLDKLTQNQIIEVNEKTIYIKNPDGLKG